MQQNIDIRELFNNNEFEEKKIIDKNIKNLCINCNSYDNIIEDFSLGIIVCTKCGQVLDSIFNCNPEWRVFEDDNKGDNNTRCGFGVSKLLPQSSLGTTIGGGKFKSRIKILHNWSAMPYRERSLHQVFKQFQEKCSNTGILKCIEDDAKIMYKTISECKHIEGRNKDKFIIIRGKNRTSLLAACIFYACKRKGMTRSPKEIAEMFNINFKDITRGCKSFQKFIKMGNIDINTGLSLPEDFVARFCKELHIKDKYIQEAIEIAINICKMNIASVHTPISIAASSILLMADINNIEEINKKLIATKFMVSEVTITKTCKKIEKYKDILRDKDKIEEYIKNMEFNQNATIPENLIVRFNKFKLPTTKKDLENIKIKYSDILGTDNMHIKVKFVIKKIRDNLNKIHF